jgi:Ca-activated chloride channel family protein
MSLTFANTAAFWLLPVLPLLVVLKALGDARAKRASAGLISPRLQDALLVVEGRARSWVVLGLELLALACFIAALARPQYGVITEDAPASGRSLIIAIDTSRSMDATDVQPSRLDRAKFAAEDLVKKLRSDRIGLLPFAGDASFLYAPITADTDAILESIQAMDSDIVARGGSNIAKAIDRAVTTFKESDLSGQQAVILFSDGEELEGEALAAAKRARDAQVAVVCVAVGTTAGGLIPDANAAGGFFRDRDNKIVQTKLQREVLMKIADITNGLYLTLDGQSINDARLDVILNKLNRSSMKKRTLETAVDRFRWPLAVGLVCLVAAFIAGIVRRYRAPSAVLPAAALLAVCGGLTLFPRPAAAQDSLLPPPVETPAVAAPEASKPAAPAVETPPPPKQGDPWQFYKEGDWRNSVFNFGIAASKARRDEDIDRLQMARGVAAFKAATQDEQKFDAGMMEQAIDAFGVALGSNDRDVLELAHYNLANAIFERAKARERERVTAEAQAKSKKAKKKHEITLKYLDSVIRQLENSLEHYEEVLTYNKDHEPARKNLEAVADLVKKLRDIRKQKAQQQGEGQGEGEGQGQGQGKGKGKGKGQGQGQGQGEGEGEEGEEGEGEGEGEDEGGGEGDQEGKGKGDKEGEGQGKGEEGKEGDGGGADESNKEFDGKAGADGDADGDGDAGEGEESSEDGGGEEDGGGGNKAGGGLDDTVRNLKNLSQELKSRPRSGPSQERRPAKDW